MVQAVIFDLDGTLLNTIEDLGEAVNHALSLHGYPLHSLEEYRGMVGHGVRNLVTQALPKELQADESLIDTCLAQFKDYYTAHIDVHTRPYPGMVEVVQQLHAHGVKLAIASNKFQSGTETLIAEFFPGIPFVAVLGNRPGYPLKPDPEIVGEVLRQASASPSQTVMVGDSLTDMKTASNGGIRGIAVSWGYRALEPSPAYALVHSPSELLSLIL